MSLFYEKIKAAIGSEGVDYAEKWNLEMQAYGVSDPTDLNRLYQSFDEIRDVEGMLERIEALPIQTRIYTLKHLGIMGISGFDVNGHLDILELAGWPEFVYVDEDFSQIKKLQRSLKSASNKNQTYRRVSSQFRTALQSVTVFNVNGTIYSMDDFDRTEFLILRSVFGEDTLTEVLLRGSQESSRYFTKTAADLIPVLQDWDSLKQYPLEWSVNLVGRA